MIVHDTVNSLLSTTSRMRRPPPISDRFINTFCFSVKYCKISLLISDHCPNFLSERGHFLGHKFGIFFCFLHPMKFRFLFHFVIERLVSLNFQAGFNKGRIPNYKSYNTVTLIRSHQGISVKASTKRTRRVA